MRKFLCGIVVMSLVLGTAFQALAWSPKLEVSEDVWMQVGFMGQIQFEAIEKGSGNNKRWSNDFFARRARILGMGSVHKNVKFFFDTDVPNAGKRGSDNSLVWNDGFVDLQFLPQFNISLGRILVPFSVENQGSAAQLLGIDYNLNATKVPTVINRAFWRDDGIEVRGLLLDGMIDYRIGLFRGERDDVKIMVDDEIVNFNRNPNDNLRTAGMVMINFADSQSGWFYNMNSLGALNILSYSVGYDYISLGGAGIKDQFNWNVGAHIDQPLGAGRIVGSATYYNWDGPYYDGKTASIQAGYLMDCPFRAGAHLQPVLRWQYQDESQGSKLNTFNIGLNYFLKGHNINFKADYAINDRKIDGKRVDAFRFQTQLLF